MKNLLFQAVIWLYSRIWPVAVLGLLMFVCISLTLSTLAGIASGPAAHPASAHLAPLLDLSHKNSLHAEQLAPPSGTARLFAGLQQ